MQFYTNYCTKFVYPLCHEVIYHLIIQDIISTDSSFPICRLIDFSDHLSSEWSVLHFVEPEMYCKSQNSKFFLVPIISYSAQTDQKNTGKHRAYKNPNLGTFHAVFVDRGILKNWRRLSLPVPIPDKERKLT